MTTYGGTVAPISFMAKSRAAPTTSDPEPVIYGTRAEFDKDAISKLPEERANRRRESKDSTPVPYGQLLSTLAVEGAVSLCQD